MFQDLAPATVALLRRWNADDRIAVILGISAGVAFLLPVFFTLVRGRGGLRRVVLGLLVATICAMAPLAPLVGGDQRISRAWYPVSASASALAACAVATPGRRRVGFLCLLPWSLLTIDCAVHVARTQVRVASRIRFAVEDALHAKRLAFGKRSRGRSQRQREKILRPLPLFSASLPSGL